MPVPARTTDREKGSRIRASPARPRRPGRAATPRRDPGRQRRAKLGSRAEAVLRPHRHRRTHHGGQHRRNRGVPLSQRRRVAPRYRRDERRAFDAGKRQHAAGHLVQHHAQAVQVRARVGRPPGEDFRRGIVQCPDESSGHGDGALGFGNCGERLGQPEVHQLDGPLGVNQDVARLDVAMHDAAGVRRPGARSRPPETGWAIENRVRPRCPRHPQTRTYGGLDLCYVTERKGPTDRRRERLPDSARGNREPVYGRAAQTRNRAASHGMCGPKAELTRNSRLHPTPIFASPLAQHNLVHHGNPDHVAEKIDDLFRTRQPAQISLDDYAVEAMVYKNGSARESDEGRILSCFAEHHELGIGHCHPLRLQQ